MLGVTNCSRPHYGSLADFASVKDCSCQAAPYYPQQHWQVVGRRGIGLGFDSLITSSNKGGEQGAKSVNLASVMK